jgi:hypothetical protein
MKIDMYLLLILNCSHVIIITCDIVISDDLIILQYMSKIYNTKYSISHCYIFTHPLYIEYNYYLKGFTTYYFNLNIY